VGEGNFERFRRDWSFSRPLGRIPSPKAEFWLEVQEVRAGKTRLREPKKAGERKIGKGRSVERGRARNGSLPSESRKKIGEE